MAEAAHPREQARQARLPDFHWRPRESGLVTLWTVEDDDWWPGKESDA